MWWDQPPLFGFRSLVPRNLVEIVARAFAVVQVGGLQGTGPERGRNFERLFYELCSRSNLLLSEMAGARTVGGQRSASGLAHEVDAASLGTTVRTHWELKYLSAQPSKNDFLIFNGKSLDFLLGQDGAVGKKPLLRFFLTGSNVNDECRRYSAFWGISIIEPDRLPLPLLYEAVVRGGAMRLSVPDRNAITTVLPRGFRSLQDAAVDLVGHASCASNALGFPDWPVEIVDMQEQIGIEMLDYLDEFEADWIDRLAEETWTEVGGW